MKKTSSESLICKICGSRHTVRDGVIKGVQRWKCKTCGRKFLNNGALHGYKTAAVQVMSALSLYYKGLSYNTIRKQIQIEFNSTISRSTIYRWTQRAPQNYMNAVKYFHPRVGNSWIADESASNICGKQVWIQDILDRDTGFILASQVAMNHDIKDVQLLMEKAARKAGKMPEVVISNTLAVYLGKIELTANVNAGYKQLHPLIVEEKSTFELENFHAILQERTNLMIALKSLDRVVEFTNGWLIQHNYFDTQESLGDKTPAEVLGH